MTTFCLVHGAWHGPWCWARLAPKLRRELAPGSRIVSNSFDMGPVWPATRRVPVDDTAVFFWKVE